MLRPILLALLLATLCAAAPARQQTDREREGLRGPVKTVGADTADYFQGAGERQPEPRRRPQDSVTYNEKGDEVSRLVYDDYGFAVGTQTHTYDAAGRRAASLLTGGNSELMSKEVFKYDAASRLVEKLSYAAKGAGGPGEELKEVFSYDARGRLSEVGLWLGVKRVGKTTYTYDGRGRLVALAFYTAAGKPAVAPVGPCFGAHRLTYKYGARDLPAEVRAHDTDNSLERTTTFTYDDRGNVAEEMRDTTYGSTRFTNKYEYDARGNWTKMETRVVSESKLSPDSGPSERLRLTRRTITYY